MKDLLVIPDIHNRYEEVERLIALFPERHKVFLGDYFDSFHDTPEVARATAQWLRYSLHQDDRTHLLGNHDLPYRWAHQYCPGFTQEKRNEINWIMKPSDWRQLKPYQLYTHHLVDGVGRPLLLSHAGFTLGNLFGTDSNMDVAPGGRLAHLRDMTCKQYLEELEKQRGEFEAAATGGLEHFWFKQGWRMGKLEVAGPFWTDIDDGRFHLPRFDQIVGHSIVDQPRRHSMPNARFSERDVWFIDGAGRFAALVDFKSDTPGTTKIRPIYAIGAMRGGVVHGFEDTPTT